MQYGMMPNPYHGSLPYSYSNGLGYPYRGNIDHLAETQGLERSEVVEAEMAAATERKT